MLIQWEDNRWSVQKSKSREKPIYIQAIFEPIKLSVVCNATHYQCECTCVIVTDSNSSVTSKGN